jgi:glycosyltransferase involved in cell wall biosynthesis
MKMRILVLENEPSSKRGGQELSLLDVARGLAEKGHKVHLVYNDEGDLLPHYEAFCASITRVWRYTIDRNSPMRTSSKWIRSVAVALTQNVDVIYANQYHDTFFGGTLAAIKCLPFVCHLRLFPPGSFCGQWSLGMKSVTRFVAVSEATRDAYIQAGISPDFVRVVCNGIDLKKFVISNDRLKTRQRLGLNADSFVILYAGRLDYDKNLEMLIDGFAKVKISGVQFHLAMVGSPVNFATSREGEAYVSGLKALCVERGVADRVRWLGRQQKMPEIFRAANITVLPTRVGETFGRTLAESMACGTPAIGGGSEKCFPGNFGNFVFHPMMRKLLHELWRRFRFFPGRI